MESGGSKPKNSFVHLHKWLLRRKTVTIPFTSKKSQNYHYHTTYCTPNNRPNAGLWIIAISKIVISNWWNWSIIAGIFQEGCVSGYTRKYNQISKGNFTLFNLMINALLYRFFTANFPSTQHLPGKVDIFVVTSWTGFKPASVIFILKVSCVTSE